MTNLKQKEIRRALIQLVYTMYLIADEHHYDELNELSKVIDTLFEELNDENKRKFQKLLNKKIKEHELD